MNDEYNSLETGSLKTINPYIIEVMIEIPKGSKVKYEFDHKTNKLICDRFLHTPMDYFFNYGDIPNTLSEDNDPMDVVVLCDAIIYPTTYINCKVLGVLYTEDESGIDPKIIVVPEDNIDPYSHKYNDIYDIDNHIKQKLLLFYENYKKLKPKKWVKVNGWGEKKEAIKLIEDSYLRYHNKDIKSKL